MVLFHSKNKINTYAYLFVGVNILYLFCVMVSYLSPGSIGTPLLFKMRFMIILFSVFTLLSIRFISFSRITLCSAIFWLMTMAVTIRSVNGLSAIIVNCIDASYWMISFVVLTNMLPMLEDNVIQNIYKGIIFAFFAFLLRYAMWLLSPTRYWSPGGINSVYYFLLILPVFFLCRSKVVKIVMLSFAAIITMISSKRTALIALIASIFVPLIFAKNDRKKRNMLVLLLAIGIIFSFSFEYLIELFDIKIFEKFSRLAEDGGSGRIRTYGIVIGEFWHSDAVLQLFGHGYNAVFLDHISKSSAHNDFLEILYDYGAIALLVYLNTIFMHLRMVKKLKKWGSEIHPVYVSALTIFIIISLFSHLIIYPTYIWMLMFFFALGERELRKVQNS